MGNPGEARIVLCEALRLAPSDKEIRNALTDIRNEVFIGPATRLGEALDALEDFRPEPKETLRAAQGIHRLVVGDEAVDDAERAVCIKAFIDGNGAATVFRRQNAMGENWMEEARNGTTSLLSKIAQAAPQMEEELYRLNREAEAKEQGCGTAHDGSVVCEDRIGPRQAPRVKEKVTRPAAGVGSLASACDFTAKEEDAIPPASKPRRREREDNPGPPPPPPFAEDVDVPPPPLPFSEDAAIRPPPQPFVKSDDDGGKGDWKGGKGGKDDWKGGKGYSKGKGGWKGSAPLRVGPGDKGRLVYVGNLTFRTAWQDVKDLFKEYGDVIRVDIAQDMDGRSKGYGTVLFSKEEDATAAIEA